VRLRRKTVGPDCQRGRWNGRVARRRALAAIDPRLDHRSREGTLAQKTTRDVAVGGRPPQGAARWVGAGGQAGDGEGCQRVPGSRVDFTRPRRLPPVVEVP